MKASHRIAWFFTLSVIVCALLGGVYGQRVEATIDGGAGSEKAMAENLNAFAKIFTLVEQNYADPVNPDQAIFGPENNNTLGAIPSMLHTLDPHSNFFGAATYARLRETEEGQYYGVGMKIVSVPLRGGQWTTTVTEPQKLDVAHPFGAGVSHGEVQMGRRNVDPRYACECARQGDRAPPDPTAVFDDALDVFWRSTDASEKGDDKIPVVVSRSVEFTLIVAPLAHEKLLARSH